MPPELVTINDLACHPSSPQIALVGTVRNPSHQASLIVYDFELGEVQWQSHSLGPIGQQVCYSPDGQWLIAGGSSEIFKIIDIQSHRVQYEFPAGEHNSALEVHPNGSTIMSAVSSQAYVRLQFIDLVSETPKKLPDDDEEESPFWENWRDQFEARSTFLSTQFLVDASISPNGNYLVATHKKCEVYKMSTEAPSKVTKGPSVIFEESTNSILSSDQSGYGAYSNAVFSPGTDILFCGTGHGTLLAWNLDREQIVLEKQAHDAAILRICMNAQGDRIMSASSDGGICFWKLHL